MSPQGKDDIARVVLDLFCSVPVTPDARFFHEDLHTMTDAQLACEHERVRLRLLVDPKPADWLLDRFDVLEELKFRNAF